MQGQGREKAQGGGEGGAAGAGGAGRRISAESIGADEMLRVASLMKIDIGERGGPEERDHIDKVRKMIAYFDVLDRADAGGGDAGGGDAGGGVPIEELRADEPEQAASRAGSYARVQSEGGAYVRAPQMPP